jgi:hypothetical protein
VYVFCSFKLCRALKYRKAHFDIGALLEPEIDVDGECVEFVPVSVNDEDMICAVTRAESQSLMSSLLWLSGYSAPSYNNNNIRDYYSSKRNVIERMKALDSEEFVLRFDDDSRRV